jgi:hypothetical protein
MPFFRRLDEHFFVLQAILVLTVADAETAGTRDEVAYQSLHRADYQGGQRNLPEGLFVLLEIKRSAGLMTGSAISSLITLVNFFLLPSFSYFLLLTLFMPVVGYFRVTDSLRSKFPQFVGP